MAQYRRSLPRCPTPVIHRVRKEFAGNIEKPKAVYFKNVGKFLAKILHFLSSDHCSNWKV